MMVRMVWAGLLAMVLVEGVGRAESSDPVITGGYDPDAGFVLRDPTGAYEMRLVGKLQTYFLGTSTVTDDERVANGQFEIHRARLGVEGKLGASVLYKAQVELGKGNAHLKDFRFDVALGRGVWLRAGQWKRPWSRQYMTSSFRLELVERAITDKAFANSRDIGVAVRNDYEKSAPIEWTVGVFEGLEDEKPIVMDETITNMPPAFKPVLVARVGVNRGGLVGYSEGDLEGGPLRWGAATAVLIEGDMDRDGHAAQRFTVDGIVKACGWSGSAAMFLAADRTSAGIDATQLGAVAQVGYVTPSRVGIAGRYAALVGLGDDPSPDQHEVAAGASWYLRGHDAKLQVDLAARKLGDASAGDNLRLEVEGQISF